MLVTVPKEKTAGIVDKLFLKKELLKQMQEYEKEQYGNEKKGENFMASQNATLRYRFEHRVFPYLFYDDPLTVMENLEAAESDYMVFLWEKFLELQDIPDDLQEQPIVFTEEDFDVQIGEQNELRYAIIKMPKATSALQCSRIGIVLSQDGKYRNYYTVERMESGDYALCGWTFEEDELCHNSYGKIAKSEEKIAKKMFHEMVSPKKDKTGSVPIKNWL